MLSDRVHAELIDLVGDLCNEALDEARRRRLEQLLVDEPDARAVYRAYMNLHASLRQYHVAGLPPKADKTALPVLGSLCDVFRAGADFLSRSFVLTLLVAIALPGIIIAVLLVDIARQPIEQVPVATAPAVVAHITNSHRCVWGENSKGFAVAARLLGGQELHIEEGLVEVTFSSGARVLLNGPAAFETRSTGEGVLRSGSLVAHVPAEARGFAIDMPTAKIVDLGTEFGACVEKQGLAADVEVFQGEVELTTPPTKDAAGSDRETACHRLTAGRAARVARASVDEPVAFVETVPVAHRFVRQIPVTDESAQPAVVADFSGGNGAAQPDQYPGAAGAGWAGGWVYRGAKGMQFTATVERNNPVLNGADYLRMLVEQTASARTRCGIERRLNPSDPVDLTKPHTVSFSVRIDTLDWFSKASDQLVLCSLSKTQSEVKGAKSGWHIRVDARDYPGVKARNWSLLSGDGKGGYTRVDSGVAVRPGETYSFRILVDPAARQWTPSIAVNGGPSTSFAPMGMRSIGTAEERGYWPYVYFYWVLHAGTQKGNAEKLGFSVDSIRITAAD